MSEDSADGEEVTYGVLEDLSESRQSHLLITLQPFPIKVLFPSAPVPTLSLQR